MNLGKIKILETESFKKLINKLFLKIKTIAYLIMNSYVAAVLIDLFKEILQSKSIKRALKIIFGFICFRIMSFIAQ